MQILIPEDQPDRPKAGQAVQAPQGAHDPRRQGDEEEGYHPDDQAAS